LSAAVGGTSFGWIVVLDESLSGADGFADGMDGTGWGWKGAGLGAENAGLSASGSLFPSGAMTMGLLAGVALGGTHSEMPSIEKPPEGSPIEPASGGRSLRRD